MSVYTMGPHTLSVPAAMWKENRERFCAAMKAANANGIVLLQGGSDVSLYDTDVDYHFRQESYFMYLFGVTEPGFFGYVDVATAKTVLFMPHLPDDYAVWMGRLWTKEDFKRKYEVDEVHYVEEMATVIANISPATIHVLVGKNSDSGLTSKPASFEGIDKFNVKSDLLHGVISECRVIKSEKEIEVLRYVAKISSDAHKQVMKVIRPGMMEYNAEAEFLNYCYGKGGCRHASYTCICGVGTNSAILHYGHAAAPNDKMINNGEMCLFDMGANYSGYAADITCSFPANGKFTPDQKTIYNVVLAAVRAVLKEARDGVCWLAMHKLANRTMLAALIEADILKGSVDDMMSAGLNYIFQPHGLGHLLGLDVHDVGGYLPEQPPRPTDPGCQALRFARTLKAGMYVTVEPGCYFITSLLDRAIADPKLNVFLNLEVLQRFRNFGGVRIEDDVLITKDGNVVFSVVPRTVEEIEAWMRRE